MFDLVFFIKFAVALSSVLILSVLFEKINPKIAGILSGYPIGTAITLFFFGFENGPEFASESAVFNIVGLITFLSFVYFYYRASKLTARFSIVVATVSAIAGFLVIAYILHLVNFTVFSAFLLSTISIPLFVYLFKRIRKIETGNRVRFSVKSIAGRAFVTGAIIVTITTIAKLVGPEWAGLLSSFPSTTLPLMLMIHYKYSSLHVHAMLKHIPEGSFSLLLYSATVYFTYPGFGIYLGTLMAYGAASVFIIISYYAGEATFISRFKQILGMAGKDTIHFIMTGGSIDSYYDRRRDTTVPYKKSVIPEYIKTLGNVKAEFTEICMKDSRELNEKDLKDVLNTTEKSAYAKIIVTVGVYKMDKVADYLTKNLKRKDQTIIVTGSTTPIVGFSPSEGPFNLGYAMAMVRELPNGVYIGFNGELFTSKEIQQLIKEGGLAAIFKAYPDAPLY